MPEPGFKDVNVPGLIGNMSCLHGLAKGARDGVRTDSPLLIPARFREHIQHGLFPLGAQPAVHRNSKAAFLSGCNARSQVACRQGPKNGLNFSVFCRRNE